MHLIQDIRTPWKCLLLHQRDLQPRAPLQVPQLQISLELGNLDLRKEALWNLSPQRRRHRLHQAVIQVQWIQNQRLLSPMLYNAHSRRSQRLQRNEVKPSKQILDNVEAPQMLQVLMFHPQLWKKSLCVRMDTRMKLEKRLERMGVIRLKQSLKKSMLMNPMRASRCQDRRMVKRREVWRVYRTVRSKNLHVILAKR